MTDQQRLITTLILSTLILGAWQYFYEGPRIQKMQHQAELQQQKKAELEKHKAAAESIIDQQVKPQPREKLIENTSRIAIISDQIRGSIALKGARFDDISLPAYKSTLDKGSPDVVLLSPSGSEKSYFAEFGWIGADDQTLLPSSNTVWKADKKTLHAGETLTLSWDNQKGLLFLQHITLDDQYMFKVTETVENNTGKPLNILPYGLINRLLDAKDIARRTGNFHEGPLGVFDSKLSEDAYSSLKSDKVREYKDNKNGWFGITDKYWLAAIVPDKSITYDTNFKYSDTNDHDHYQVDYLGQKQVVEDGKSLEITNRFFAGAKRVELLDHYRETLNIPLFDRAIDFGWFYFLTKPMFHLLQFFYSQLGNFGLAILMITVMVKLLMFPLANKSYKAMNKMKKLQPEMVRLREKHKDDKVELNKEIMALYRRESANPMAGCLPMIIQIPVFFSLYKVFSVTIEMRHAPFYGWIHDLSAPDPTSVFNLFGVIPYHLPDALTIGLWPLIMCATMLMQQRLQPEPTDPVQAKVMKFMPYFFLYIMHAFPAGLIIYWAWNNCLSVLQQMTITKLSK